MKKVSLSILFLLAVFASSNAQSYLGLTSENYAGVHGLLYNPATIADSRFTADINVIGGSGFVANDFYGFDFTEMLSEEYTPNLQATRTQLVKNNLSANLDVLGPSFMMTLDDKNAIGFITRARVFYTGRGINGKVAETIGRGFKTSRDFSLKQDDITVNGNSWMEFGGSFARVLHSKGKHFIKGGATLKLLRGMSNAYANTKGLTIDYDAAGNVTTGGEIIYSYSENLKTGNKKTFFADKAVGFGADLGVVYELRSGKFSNSEEENKYKLRLGLSIVDIGALSYGSAVEETYDMTKTLNGKGEITEDEFETMDDFEDLKDFYVKTGQKDETERSVMPTSIHLDADYSVLPKFYVNLNGNISINSNKVNRVQSTNYVSLVPRYETKWVSAYMPLSYMDFSGFNWGAGLRAGPLYIGSGSLFSMLMNKEAKGIDAYVGVKVPLYRKNNDTDKDGVLNKVDECPDEAGPADNKGCPVKDEDEDGVKDDVDNCPSEKGPKENDGCPWGDADEDGINDNEDRCPEKAGTEENNGCPSDKDGDGVYDLEDECPEKVGTVAGKGCPELSDADQKKLNSYAKTILFDTGKASIREQSNEVLNEIIDILKEYPNAKFLIEGHTDSSGSAMFNQRLSDSRANQVKKYLIDNGIDAFRLSSVGYGEEKPISSNATRDGRKQNRRVEINLVRE